MSDFKCEKHGWEWTDGDPGCPFCLRSELDSALAENAKLRETHEEAKNAVDDYRHMRELAEDWKARHERIVALVSIKAMEDQAKELAELRVEIGDRAKERDVALLQNSVMRAALEDIAKREGPGLDGSSENTTGRKARLALEGKYETPCPTCGYSYWYGSCCTYCGYVEKRVDDSRKLCEAAHPVGHGKCWLPPLHDEFHENAFSKWPR